MPEPTIPSPLIGVAQRRAHATNAGFTHQHWLSVLAWLQLQDWELLVIEGVEDIDRVGPGRADLIQVKRRSDILKLSTKEAAVVVGNYLVASAKNGNYDIYLSYVTTASAGPEPHTNFKTDQRGAIIWRACSQADEIKDDLHHDFLQLPDLLRRPLVRRAAKAQKQAGSAVAQTDDEEDDDAELNNEEQSLRYLADHLSNITPESFLYTLVRRINWDVCSPDTDSIMSAVCQELSSYADRIEVRPKTLQECRFRLLSRVMEAAGGRNQGRLTRTELEAEIQNFLEMLSFTPPAAAISASVEGASE